MGAVVEGFSFSDFCLRCQKVTEHKIEAEAKDLFGKCQSCGEQRIMTDLKQTYYPTTELWVTRFKIGKLPSVVTGKLLDAARHGR
jgi:hypothetical protein